MGVRRYEVIAANEKDNELNSVSQSNHVVSFFYYVNILLTGTYYHSFMALNRCEKKNYRSFSSVVTRFFASCGNSYKALQFI